MQFAKHKNDNDVSWMAENKRFENVDRDTINLIKTLTGVDIRFKEKGDVVNMWVAWENGIKQARIEGEAIGRNKGEANMITAIRMIKENKPSDIICKETGISNQRLTELRSML